ncbi:MAG: cysteine synthase family protein [Pseudomonadota bacterium]
MLMPSVIDAIGNTPLVELSRIRDELGLKGRLLAKLDYLNPGFSKKDRAAKSIIEAARESGELSEGQTVVELTSGNMGTGLAIVCGVLGHPFVAVMSEGNSEERAAMMRALGAEVVLVPQKDGSIKGEVSGEDLALVEIEAQRLTKERGAFRADQFAHVGNPAAHANGTGPEIWMQSGGAVTAFCDFFGSGGTLAGAAAFFEEKGVRSYGVKPDKPNHPIQGGGYNMPDLTHMKDANLAGLVSVSGEMAEDYARQLARTEGIFGGYSAGANLAASVELLRVHEQGSCVAFVVCDSGLKYLSTDLWG